MTDIWAHCLLLLLQGHDLWITVLRARKICTTAPSGPALSKLKGQYWYVCTRYDRTTQCICVECSKSQSSYAAKLRVASYTYFAAICAASQSRHATAMTHACPRCIADVVHVHVHVDSTLTHAFCPQWLGKNGVRDRKNCPHFGMTGCPL